jgi:hypothetical protein
LDEYTAARALRLRSGLSPSELPRRWFSRIHREVMDGSPAITKEISRATDETPKTTDNITETMEDGLGGIPRNIPVAIEGLAIMDTTTGAPYPMCC